MPLGNEVFSPESPFSWHVWWENTWTGKAHGDTELGREVEKFSQLSEKGHVQMIFDSTDFHLSRLAL